LRAVCTYPPIFEPGFSDGVIKIFPLPTLIAMAMNFRFWLSDKYRLFVRLLDGESARFNIPVLIVTYFVLYADPELNEISFACFH